MRAKKEDEIDVENRKGTKDVIRKDQKDKGGKDIPRCSSLFL